MSDVSLAVSETAFAALYNRVAPTVSLPFDGATSPGPLWFGVDGAIRVAGAGAVDFEDSNSFWLDELTIGWDKLVIRLGFDIPTVTVGRFCVMRFPDDVPVVGGDCMFTFPGGELFGGAPDIGPVKINLNAIMPFIVMEVSGRFDISLVKDKDTLKLKVHPQAVDVDPLSIEDSFNQLPGILQAGIVAAGASFVAAHPPAFLLDMALGILGFPSVTELLLDILDIGDDVQEWLTRRLNVDIGLPNLLAGIIAGAVLDKTMFDIPDPYELLPASTVSVDKFGGFTDPQPAPPSTTLAVPRAAIVDPEARFDADMLHIRFNLGV